MVSCASVGLLQRYCRMAMVPDVSPHGVEVIVWRYIVLIITGETQLIAITLMDKVPQLFGTEGLQEGDIEQPLTLNSSHSTPH